MPQNPQHKAFCILKLLYSQPNYSLIDPKSDHIIQADLFYITFLSASETCLNMVKHKAVLNMLCDRRTPSFITVMLQQCSKFHASIALAAYI